MEMVILAKNSNRVVAFDTFEMTPCESQNWRQRKPFRALYHSFRDNLAKVKVVGSTKKAPPKIEWELIISVFNEVFFPLLCRAAPVSCVLCCVIVFLMCKLQMSEWMCLFSVVQFDWPLTTDQFIRWIWASMSPTWIYLQTYLCSFQLQHLASSM